MKEFCNVCNKNKSVDNSMTETSKVGRFIEERKRSKNDTSLLQSLVV